MARRPNFTLPTCPHCGQRMLRRHGADLSPQAALIFDLIEQSKTRGVRADVLASVFYSGKPEHVGRRLIYQHVFRINEALQSTPVRVTIRPPAGNYSMPGRAAGYYVVKRRQGAAGHMRGGGRNPNGCVQAESISGGEYLSDAR